MQGSVVPDMVNNMVDNNLIINNNMVNDNNMVNNPHVNPLFMPVALPTADPIIFTATSIIT